MQATMVRPFSNIRVLYGAMFMLAATMLLAMLLATLQLSAVPDDGLIMLARVNNQVQVRAGSPADQAGIREGDQLLAVDGAPPAVAGQRYGLKVPGDQVMLELARNNQRFEVALTLGRLPIWLMLQRAEPLAVALVYWIVAIASWVLRPEHRVTRVFYVLSNLVAAVLVTGVVSTDGHPPIWLVPLFNILLLVVGPVWLHLYTIFPQSVTSRHSVRLVRGAYLIALVLSLITVAEALSPGLTQYSSALWPVRRLFVAIALLLGIVILLRAGRDAPQSIRQRRRLLLAGMALSILPLLLSIISEAILGTALISYYVAFPFLILLPLSFGYALRQGELGRIDLILNRSLVYVIVAGTLLSAYALLGSIAGRLPIAYASPVINTLALIGVAALFAPLRTLVQRRVDHRFYGGWYDYRSLVRGVSAELSQVTGRARLEEQLLAAAKSMHFTSVLLLWLDEGRDSPIGFGASVERMKRHSLSADGTISQVLASSAMPLTRRQLTEMLALETLDRDERSLLEMPQSSLWFPLKSHGLLRGVLILGERQVEQNVDSEDLDILTTLAFQAGIAADNVSLVEALRLRLSDLEHTRDDLKEAQQRLADNREAERLHLAQELHDGPVQELYGVHFQIAGIGSRVAPDIQTSIAMVDTAIEAVVSSLRAICGELRPPTLTSFGLQAAIRSHAINMAEAEPSLLIRLDLMNDGQTLPERTRLALFRIYQEALNNIRQHAQARHASVLFTLDAEQVVLEIRDDGKGFQVPERWIELAREGHLGLLGISERTGAVNGELDVRSTPGHGTVVRVTAPPPETDTINHGKEVTIDDDT